MILLTPKFLCQICPAKFTPPKSYCLHNTHRKGNNKLKAQNFCMLSKLSLWPFFWPLPQFCVFCWLRSTSYSARVFTVAVRDRLLSSISADWTEMCPFIDRCDDGLERQQSLPLPSISLQSWMRSGLLSATTVQLAHSQARIATAVTRPPQKYTGSEQCDTGFDLRPHPWWAKTTQNKQLLLSQMHTTNYTVTHIQPFPPKMPAGKVA